MPLDQGHRRFEIERAPVGCCHRGEGLRLRLNLETGHFAEEFLQSTVRNKFKARGGSAGRLPSAVRAVAMTAAAGTKAGHEGQGAERAVARVRTRSGTWAVIHGSCVASTEGLRVSIIIEPAQPARISSLLMAAYELTKREEELTRLILRGHSSAQIAEALFVSVNTVQQHLKSIFDKTGVRSRRDLAGKIFFAHYEPRFRQNERRVIEGLPVRGGPAESR